MMRHDKEITDKRVMETIIRQATVCRLGMSYDSIPYVIPLCFGYKDSIVYLHSALKGKRIDILRENPNICVEFDINAELITKQTPCRWGMKFQSVIGFGKACLVEGIDEKKDALDIIMRHYGGRIHDVDDKALGATSVIRVEIHTMTGKQSGF